MKSNTNYSQHSLLREELLSFIRQICALHKFADFGKDMVIKMGYIMDLRKHVGHQALIMTSACVLILNEKNQVLLQRRADNGFWGYPGGSMELGESFEECAKREALEETGLECIELTYFTHMSGEKMHYIYPNGDEVYISEIVFLCKKYQGELKVQETEVHEQKFFDLDSLPDHISPINKDVLQMLVERHS